MRLGQHVVAVVGLLLAEALHANASADSITSPLEVGRPSEQELMVLKQARAVTEAEMRATRQKLRLRQGGKSLSQPGIGFEINWENYGKSAAGFDLSYLDIPRPPALPPINYRPTDSYGGRGEHFFANDNETYSRTVIFLQGIGEDTFGLKEQMFERFREVCPQLFQDTKFIIGIPTNDLTLTVWPEYGPVPAWWDIKGYKVGDFEDLNGVYEAGARIDNILKKEREKVGNNIVLAGFSQGGALTYFAGSRHMNILKGILVIGGYLPGMGFITYFKPWWSHFTKMLHLHGIDDDVVPRWLGQLSATYMKGLNYKTEFEPFECLKHYINEAEMDRGVRFIAESFGLECKAQ